MPLQVVNQATTMCTMSPKPSQLTVLPAHQRNAAGQPAATIQDHVPIVNVQPFGPCMSLAYPPTAAATTAAGGILTPQQCVPNTQTPWTPGSPVVTIGNQPALVQTDTCQCVWGGTITIVNPGQTIVNDS